MARLRRGPADTWHAEGHDLAVAPRHRLQRMGTKILTRLDSAFRTSIKICSHGYSKLIETFLNVQVLFVESMTKALEQAKIQEKLAKATKEEEDNISVLSY